MTLKSSKQTKKNKGQFYLIAAISIAIIMLPILVSTYSISYTRIEESPHRISTNINKVLRSMDIWIDESEYGLIGKSEDVLLTLATSGGLGINIEDVINASKLFLECANETDRVSLYQFPYCPSKTGVCNCNTSQLTDYLYLTESNKADMKNIIDGFEKFGKSPIRRAVQESKSIITTQSDPRRNRMEILLATGPENCGGDPCIAADGFPKGVPVYTVGFKIGRSGEEQLRCIAQKTGGQYFYAGTGEDLRNIFCTLGRGWEAEIVNFLTFIKAAIGERLLDLSFDILYTTSLATEVLAEDTDIKLGYVVMDDSRSLSGKFYYNIYENSSLIEAGTEAIDIAAGELYTKETSVPKHAATNYTSVAYIESGGEKILTNELTLPHYESYFKLTVKNIEVSYNVSTDDTFVMDKATIPVHAFR